MSNKKGKKKSEPHRIILVEGVGHRSLCDTCKYKPSGKIPQSNAQVREKLDEQVHQYCTKKAFFPGLNWADGTGEMFYDVAKCDGYERDNNQ
tara:strand:- start:30500 stop:30775 length:276 start_codon:yes stop_codon:yes gene_type:complete